ncbi:MAG: hypothetical protein ACR2HB_15825 [Dehalococcoidia bacterium]
MGPNRRGGVPHADEERRAAVEPHGADGPGTGAGAGDTRAADYRR